MDKITREQSVKEVESWLDYKKVNAKKREAYKDNIENLIDAVSDGSLVLNEDMVFQHNLNFPLDGETPLTKLEYKPRIKVNAVYNQLQGVKASDVDGRLHAYIAALTGKPVGVIRHLDTEDLSIANNIAIFFL